MKTKHILHTGIWFHYTLLHYFIYICNFTNFYTYTISLYCTVNLGVCPSPSTSGYQQLTFYYSAATGKCYSDPIGSAVTSWWPYWLNYQHQYDPYYTCTYGYNAQVLSILSAAEQSFIMSKVFASMAKLTGSNIVWLNGYYGISCLYIDQLNILFL